MSDSDSKALTRTFPKKVHVSLLELQELARTVKSRDEWKAKGRRATDEERQLAETQRLPHHCTGYSSRTGLPCRQNRVYGMEVCRKHGGSIPAVKAKAQMRLAGAVEPVIANMVSIATQTENPTAAVKAGIDCLDRAGIGELVQAKVNAGRPIPPGEYNPDKPSVSILGILGANIYINPAPEARRQLLKDPTAVIGEDRITTAIPATVVERSEP